MPWPCAALLGLGVFPSFLEARRQGHLTRCKTNLKNLATALEMYSSDNRGRYPPRLDKLLRPDPAAKPYLWELPTCPAAGSMTYSGYQAAIHPDLFTLFCQGTHHGQQDWPHYNCFGEVHDHP